jgi:DNA-binding MarR family transcriptional regulator
MSDVHWLNEDEHEAWLILLALMETIPAAVDAQLRRDHGMTRFEYYVLAMLSDREDGTRPMTDLAVMTNGSLSRLSHAVGKLEKHGWVTRCPSAQDRRTSMVSLTDAGYACLEAAAPSHVAEVRRILFDALPAGSVTQLSEILRPVVVARTPEGILVR